MDDVGLYTAYVYDCACRPFSQRGPRRTSTQVSLIAPTKLSAPFVYQGSLGADDTTTVVYLIGGLITGVLQRQVHHGVLQSPAHVELQRQVVHALQGQTQTHTLNKVTIASFCILFIILFSFHCVKQVCDAHCLLKVATQVE